MAQTTDQRMRYARFRDPAAKQSASIAPQLPELKPSTGHVHPAAQFLFPEP